MTIGISSAFRIRIPNLHLKLQRSSNLFLFICAVYFYTDEYISSCSMYIFYTFEKAKDFLKTINCSNSSNDNKLQTFFVLLSR